MKQGVKIEDIRRIRSIIDRDIRQKSDSVRLSKKAQSTANFPVMTAAATTLATKRWLMANLEKARARF